MWAKADIIILGLHQLMYLLHESCFSDLDQPVGLCGSITRHFV